MAVYLITGANRGLGLEMARQLAARGERVIGTARRVADAGALRDVADRVIEVDVGDVAPGGGVERLGRELADEQLDVLVNNAGMSSESKSVEGLDGAELARVMLVNAIAPMMVTRAVLPALRQGTRRLVFSVSSILGSIAENDGGSSYGYRASKAALNQFNKCLANELRPEGFCCVVAHPGWVRTDMGGEKAPLTREESVQGMLKVMDGLGAGDTGRYLDYQGREIAW